MFKRFGLVATLGLSLVVSSACGASREAIINRTSVGLVAARTAFTTQDERMQMALVEGSANKAEAEARISAHRKSRDMATKAFQAAWSALAVASLEPSDANMQRLTELAGAAVATLNDVSGGGAQ